MTANYKRWRWWRGLIVKWRSNVAKSLWQNWNVKFVNIQYTLVGRKNYGRISEGADSIRTTNFRDHAKSDQHVYVMNLHRKQLAIDKAASYAPIVSALEYIAPEEHQKLQKKFDIAYFLSTE